MSLNNKIWRMMISKEKFKKYTDALEALHASHVEKDKAVEVLYPMGTVWHDVSGELELIMVLLGDLMECNWDTNDTYSNDIEWYWYESYTSDKKPLSAIADGVEYVIGSFDDLYDFIVTTSKRPES